MQLQETMCVTRPWDLEEYEHIEDIPKITPENPNSDSYRKIAQHSLMALEEGSLLGLALFLGDLFLNCSPFYSQSFCHSYLLQILLGEMTPVQNPAQHLQPWLWPLALLHSAGNSADTTREFRLWAGKIFSLKSWAGLDNCILFHTFPACHTLARQYASVTSSNSALKGNATFQREWSISLTLPVNMLHQGVTNMLLLPHCQRWCHYQAW